MPPSNPMRVLVGVSTGTVLPILFPPSSWAGRKKEYRPTLLIAFLVWRVQARRHIGQVAILGVTCVFLSCYLFLQLGNGSPLFTSIREEEFSETGLPKTPVFSGIGAAR
jgi:hypothetical protein